MAFLDLSGLPAWSSTEAFVFYVTFLLVWWLRAGRSRLTLPGPWGFPVLGHLPMLGARSFVTMDNYRKWYGDVYKLRMGQRDVVVVNGPTAIRTALVKNANWHLHRRIVHRGITTTINDKKVPTDALISEEAMCLVRRMNEHKGEPFDPHNDVQETVMHVLFRLCFGKSCRPQDDALCEQLRERFNGVQALQPKLGIVDLFPCTEYLLFRYVEHFKHMATDLTRLIQPRVDEHLKERGESRDLMDTWLALADGTDETDVMGAGIETTTNIIHWALLYMAAHPRVQKRVQREIDEVVGRDRDPKQSDRELLAFTDACLIEVMRHSSVLPLMLPHSTTCDTSLGGHAIPRDTMVFFNVYSLCRDEDLWEDSHEFRPERFESKEGKLKAVDLLQFGLGRRRCIGEDIGRLQVFMLFTTLMQRCTFRFPDDVTLPVSLDGDLGITWRSKPYSVIAEARNEF
ncbi:Cytochrome P450 1A1 [Lamellibrachia satsuma]|nr:Cytochrome P450 1A1 [Lamellibrachia satsuma]